MPKTEQIYRRTKVGLSAYEDPSSGLRSHHRIILALVETDTHTDLVRASLRRYYSEAQILQYLEELQALGFLECEAMTANHDLDFTGGFNIADLRVRQKAA